MSEGKIIKKVKCKCSDNPWLKYCRRCGGETESRDVKELIEQRGKAVIQIFNVCTVCNQINGRRWEDGEAEVNKKVEEKSKVLTSVNIKTESAPLQVRKPVEISNKKWK